MNTKQVKESMEYLKSKHWTDLGTRAVIIDVVCYNPNIRMFISVRPYVCLSLCVCVCARLFTHQSRDYWRGVLQPEHQDVHFGETLCLCEICARTFVYKMIMDVVCYDLNIRMFISVRQCMCVCMYMRVCLGTRAMSRDHWGGLLQFECQDVHFGKVLHACVP